MSENTQFYFSANLIIERVLRKSLVNGATKLKRYSYIGIGKYFRVCQKKFPLGVSAGRRAP